MPNFQHRRISLLGVGFLLLTLACQSSAATATTSPLSPSTAQPQVQDNEEPDVVLVRAGANATPTATPFQPLPITATTAPTTSPTPAFTITPTIPPLATSTPFPRVWKGYPDPIIYPPIAIPPPMGIFAQPDHQINILFMGSDQRPYDSSFRTDLLMLITINAELNQISVTSFPRDLYVYLPGWTMERINVAQKYGGFQMTSLTFEYNFGVHIDHWALIDFKGFKTLVDAMGGLDVQVGKQVSDIRAGYYYTIEPGLVHMDADLALWYARSRKTSNDFERVQRQQEVLEALFLRLLELDTLAQAPELYERFKENVETDITFEELIMLAPIVTKVIIDGDIKSYVVNKDYVTAWVNPYSGAQVLLPNQEAIRDLMKSVLSVPE